MAAEEEYYTFKGLTQAKIDQIIASVSSINGHTLEQNDFWIPQGYMTWVRELTYGGYTDWRLPQTVDGLEVWGTDGTTTSGCNI